MSGVGGHSSGSGGVRAIVHTMPGSSPEAAPLAAAAIGRNSSSSFASTSAAGTSVPLPGVMLSFVTDVTSALEVAAPDDAGGAVDCAAGSLSSSSPHAAASVRSTSRAATGMARMVRG